jgi:hypothetical protein
MSGCITIEIERDERLVEVTAEYQIQHEPAQRDAGGRMDVGGFDYVEFGVWKDVFGIIWDLNSDELESAERRIFSGE